MKGTRLYIAFTLLIFTSCAYKSNRATSAGGIKYTYRVYKDDTRNEAYLLKNVFSYLNRINISSKFEKEILEIENEGYSIYQFDSISIIHYTDSNYSSLLLNGLIPPNILYRYLVNSNWALKNWESNFNTINDINRLKEIETNDNHMRFEISAYLGKCPCFGPSQSTFYLEINNSTIDKLSDLNAFYYGANICGFGNSISRL